MLILRFKKKKKKVILGGGGGLYLWVEAKDCAYLQWCRLYKFFFLNSVRSVIYNILMCCDIKIEHLMNGELLNNMLK